MTAISVVLATFNGQEYLPAQLESLAVQTSPPEELVVSDDGSTDATLEIIADFARRAPFPVHVTRNPTRVGYARNFMSGATRCTSELVAFCDQDDEWAAHKLEVMRRPFDDPTVLLAYHNSTLVEGRGKALGTVVSRRRSSGTSDPLAVHPWRIVPGHTQVVRRSLNRLAPLHVDSVDPYGAQPRMPHDHWYLFWSSVLGRTAYVALSLVSYRQHRDNASGWPYPDLKSFVLDHIRHAEEYVRANVTGARNRLALLRRAGELLDGEERNRVAAAMPWYEALLGRCERRLSVYEGRSPLARGRALLDSLGRRDYTTGPDPGLDGLLLDAFVGVPSRLLGRPSRKREDV